MPGPIRLPAIALTPAGTRTILLTAEADAPAREVLAGACAELGVVDAELGPPRPWSEVAAPIVLAPGRSACGPGDDGIEVTCLAGPDAGWRVRLGTGSWSIGREAGNALTIDDPRLVRSGARLDVGPGRLRLHLPSAAPRQLRDGEVIALGGSLLMIGAPGAPDPGVMLERIELPALPAPATARRLHLLGMLAPVLLAGMMVMVTQSWTFLAICLLSPVTGTLTWWGDRRRRRREDAAAQRIHAGQLAEARAVIARQLGRAEQDSLRGAAQAVAGEDSESIHLGIGPRPAPFAVAEPRGPASSPEMAAAAISLPRTELDLEISGSTAEVTRSVMAVLADVPGYRAAGPLPHGLLAHASDGAELVVRALDAAVRICSTAAEGEPAQRLIVHGGDAGLRAAGRPPLGLVLSGLSEAEFHRRRALLASTAGGLHGLSLPALVPMDAASLRHRWAEQSASTRITLGTRSGEAFTVDLAAQGPHALIAGTTGSGKSELLQTLVVGMCAVNSPELLSVVLIDYKGGAAFGSCAELPHVSALITDLDAHETARALRALRAELHRREELLAERGAHHLDAYNAESPVPLARLLIVIDEFRALAQALPELIEGLVAIAALGRSLGVHLVLATQRPAGIVTADMRANLGLRIALRVRDRSDSMDVLESDAAVRISAQTPGRGYLRSDSEPEIGFQAAQLDPGSGERWPAIEEISAEAFSHASPQRAPGPGQRFTASAFIAAADGHRATPIWHPALPERLDADELCTEDAPAQPLALADEPDRQRRRIMGLDRELPGHLLVIGSSGCGRTTALRTAVMSLCASEPGTSALLIDPTVQADTLADQPCVRGHLTGEEPWRISRLLEWLDTEIARRRTRDAPQAGIVIGIDGWEAMLQLEPTPGTWSTALVGIARSGAAAGIRLIITGERRLASHQIASAIASRLVMRLADPQDAAFLGISPRSLPTSMPPGRAIVLGSEASGARLRLEAQVVLPGCFPETAEGRAPRFTALPRRPEAPRGDEGAWPLGLHGDAAEPFCYRPAEHGRTLLVAGRAGSGRSTALRRFLAHLDGERHAPERAGTDDRGAGHDAEWSGTNDRNSAASGWAGPVDRSAGLAVELAHAEREVCVLGEDLPGGLGARAFCERMSELDDHAVIVIDGLDSCPREVEQGVRARLTSGSEDLLVVSCSLSPGSAISTLIGHPRAVGPVVLLDVRGPADGEILGRRDLAPIGGSPGRGWLSRRGTASPIQLYAG